MAGMLGCSVLSTRAESEDDKGIRGNQSNRAAHTATVTEEAGSVRTVGVAELVTQFQAVLSQSL